MSIRRQILRASTLLLLAVATLLSSCSHNHTSYEVSPAHVDIATLKSLCSSHSQRINQPIFLPCVVMANDWLGEYYKRIVVADSTGGIEILIDNIDLYLRYPTYSHIEVACQGLWLGRFGSNIVLGGEPTGEYPVEPLSVAHAEKVIYHKSDLGGFTPPQMRFDEINEEEVGRVALFSRIRVVDHAASWCDSDDEGFVTTYRAVESHDGHMLHIRTLGTTVYAGHSMPAGEFDAMAVIGYADERFYLHLINYGAE